MINTIIAIDNEDLVLGEFFTECLNDIESFENELKNLSVIKSNILNELYLSFRLNGISNFIFLAFSHGSKESLVKNGVPYVSLTSNINLFLNSFFYTCSCHSGSHLAPKLIENGCSSYIGYDDEFHIWDYNRKPFVECANFGYKLFLEGFNIKTIIEMMKRKYDDNINNYENDFFGAAFLLSNKNALIAHGNLELNFEILIENILN